MAAAKNDSEVIQETLAHIETLLTLSETNKDISAVEQLHNLPLNIYVRSRWESMRATHEGLGEYYILLMTEGVPLRIIGALNKAAVPMTASLEHCAWLVPWAPVAVTPAQTQLLLRFARLFAYRKF